MAERSLEKGPHLEGDESPFPICLNIDPRFPMQGLGLCFNGAEQTVSSKIRARRLVPGLQS